MKTDNLKVLRWTLAVVATAVCAAAAGEPLGLVFAGGGAKGAYEVGVWSALEEAGRAGDVAAVSGTSIGSVNAALFASWPDPEGAKRLWLENLGKVFVANERILQIASEKKVGEFVEERMQEYAEIAGVPAEALPEESRAAIEKEAREEFRRKGILRDLTAALNEYREALDGKGEDGLCDGDALRAVLEDNLPEDWPRATPRVYATALEQDTWISRAFCLNEGTPEDRIRRLLASTAIPVVFPPVEIDGKKYVDGGWEVKGGDNIPIGPILEKHPEIRTVVVVYLKDAEHLDRGRRKKVVDAAERAGVRLVEIVPSEDIGRGFLGWQGVFDARPETAKHLMELGREDARKKLSEAWP